MTGKQGEQGTGKHSHKDTEASGRQQSGGQDQDSERQRADQAQAGSKPGQGGGDESESLKEREYRDEQGNIHHHTKKYMEQHGKEQDKDK